MLAFSYTKSQFVSINVDKESVTSFTSPLHQNTYGNVRLSYKQWGYPLTLHSSGPSSLKQHVFSDATAHMIIMPTSTALYSVLPGVLGSRDTKARTDEGAPFIRHAVCSVTGDTHPTFRCRPKKWVRPHCWSTVAAG